MKITPMLQQFLDAKASHPDCVLLFRMGDFYETFFEDAETVARELDLTLTARHKDSDSPVPMAGVPHHAAEGYVRRLVKRGFHVAICEQLEDPSKAKGLVRRGVVRVITPGVVIDEEALEAKSHNFLAALAVSSTRSSDVTAIAVVDASTGELRVCELITEDAVVTELRRLQPAELLIADVHSGLLGPTAERAGVWVTERGERALSLERVVKSASRAGLEVGELGQQAYALNSSELRERLSTLDQSVFRDRKAVESALALVLDYLMGTMGGVPSLLAAPEVYRSDDFLVLDPASAANLEIFETLMGGRRKGSLFSVIDQTVTAAGGRRLRTWLSYPLTDVERIRHRQGSVSTLVDRLEARTRLREMLTHCADIQRVSGKLAAGQGNARDLVTLAETLGRVPEVVEVLAPLDDPGAQRLREEMDPCDDVAAAIGAAVVDEPPVHITDGGLIRRGYSAELDTLLDLTTDGKNWLLAFEAAERESTGISSLKVKHNRVFGYYIEVTRANMDAVPDHYVRKQTLANAERYFTPELKEYEDQILGAQERRAALEYEIFEEVRGAVVEQLSRLRATAEKLATLDALAALAELAHRRDYVAPELVDAPGIHIVGGRHPVVETMVEGGRFVPNDLRLDEDCQLIVLTGPNMAGKSTVIRQAALIVLLAQIGSHVPARSARIGTVDQIFSRVGASDNLARGQSTFMVEMTETAHILRHATERSLVILDEIGRGTATYDGLSIAWAVAEHLHDEVGAFTLFATHYHELTALPRLKPHVRNFNIAAKEWNDDIVFLHTMVEGPANRSYGIQVARLAGVPGPVVERARAVLHNLESTDYDEEPRLARDEDAALPRKRPTPQLSLFGETAAAKVARPDPMLDELAELSLDALSPIEALNLLYAFQKRAAKAVKKRDNNAG